MDLIIREARPDDAAAVVQILNPIIETGLYTALDEPFTVAAERDFITNMSARSIFHVAERKHDGQLVGFQSLAPFPSYTRAFDHVATMGTFIDLTLRRQGIAKRLFPVTFAAAIAKGYKKIFTYVRADNPAALATYRKHGFRIIGTAEKQLYRNGQYIDEIIIEKWLLDEHTA